MDPFFQRLGVYRFEHCRACSGMPPAAHAAHDCTDIDFFDSTSADNNAFVVIFMDKNAECSIHTHDFAIHVHNQRKIADMALNTDGIDADAEAADPGSG